MSEETDQVVDAVAKLTALTQEGKLQWSVDSFSDDSSIVGPTYRAEHKGQLLRLQNRRVSVNEDFSRRRRAGTEYFLDFVDEKDNSLWTFPHIDAVEHLYGAVRYQTAGVKNYLDDLLSDG